MQQPRGLSITKWNQDTYALTLPRMNDNKRGRPWSVVYRHAVTRLSFDSPWFRASVRQPIPVPTSGSSITAFPPFFHPLSRSSPQPRHPRVVWPGQAPGERQRERAATLLPVFPIWWERENAFSSVSRGLVRWLAGWLAGTQGDRTGRERERERELVYGTARLEINVHRYTPSTILLNGGLVEKYFVHAGRFRTVGCLFLDFLTALPARFFWRIDFTLSRAGLSLVRPFVAW